MSAAEDHQTNSTDAAEIEAKAMDWFGRRQFWNWKPEDQADLDAWLGAKLAHRVAYWRLEAAWGRTERLIAIPQLTREQRAPEAGQKKWPNLMRVAFGAVAIIAIAVFGAYGMNFFQHNMQTYATSIGETRTLTFADGSQIQLNTDTVLRTSLNGNRRAAELDKGEAYFQIKHDAAHPFVVLVAGHRITDLGTKFLVRHNGGQIQVTLVEGKARIDAADASQPKHSAVLTPGDIAIATPDSISVSKSSAQELAETLSWRTGMLVFDNMTLGDAAAEFNRYNQVQLVIVGSSVGRTPIAGRFPINGVDRFAEVVKHVFGLHVQEEGEVRVISR